MTHDEMIAVITHHKNGGELECRCKGDGVWIIEGHLDARGFNFADFDYRAKPEPLVLFIATDSNERVIYADKSKPLSHDLSMKVRKFVEVEE